MQAFLYHASAIVCEVIATSLLKASDGFRRLWPTVGTIAGYLAAFYLFSMALKTIPIGVAYAIWSGVGILLISLIGWIIFKQRIDLAAIVGMVLIAAGVVVINLFSKSVSH